MTGGDIRIKSDPGKVTSIEAEFIYSSIDRKPLGDMIKTMIVLIAGNPDVDFYYHHIKGKASYCLDTTALRKELDDVPIDHPDVIGFIKKDLEQGLKELGVVFY